MDKLDNISSHNFGRVFSINVIIVICILLPLFLVPSVPSEGETDTGWDGVSIDTDFDLNDVVAINSTAAMAVGENGKIFTTSNAGTNWSESESGTINDLNSIDFLDVVIVIKALNNEASHCSTGGAGQKYDCKRGLLEISWIL